MKKIILNMKRFSFYVFVAALTFIISTFIAELCNQPICVISSRSRRVSSCVPDSEKFKQKLRILENSNSKFYSVSCVCPEKYSTQSCRMIMKIMVDN